MIIGIDLGGTHTDGVLVSREKNDYQIKRSVKIPTDHTDLKKSILKLLDILTKDTVNKDIKRVVLSTTLVTNVIYENKYSPVGLILIPGPGLNPEHLKYGEENIILDGSIDHRGKVVKELDDQKIKKALNSLQKKGIKKLAVVSKFSVRNPALEKRVKEIIEAGDYDFETVSLGHQLSGKLNFHRRVITTYFNTAVSSVHNNFTDSMEKSLQQRNIKAELYLLKCDGGTINIEQSKEMPIETINSGPAASIMGAMLLNKNQESGIVLDIGGTTTDFGLFIKGDPAFKPKGINIAERPSLIRGLYSHSIALGGDSELWLEEGELKIGPRRKGPAAALGGPAPTPTDALLILGKISDSDIKKKNFKIKKAENALLALKKDLDLNKYSTYLNQNKKIELKSFAELIIDQIAEKIKNTITKILKQLENQPVYTITELLESPELDPSYLAGIGGPAAALIDILAQKLNLKAFLPEHSKLANAVGAAFARPTVETTVRADTARGFIDIVEAGIHRPLENKNFSLTDAENLAQKWTLKRFSKNDYPVEIISKENFNVVRRHRTLGQIIEVKAQIKPGLISDLRR